MREIITSVVSRFFRGAQQVDFIPLHVWNGGGLPLTDDIGEFLDPDIQGVYVLTNNERCIYVGKGILREKIRSDYLKASGAADTYPDGWLAFQGRLNNKQTFKDLKRNGRKDEIPLPENERREFLERFECGNWIFRYLVEEDKTITSAIESCLIAVLQPVANKETYRIYL
jgi:hypothetical protein